MWSWWMPQDDKLQSGWPEGYTRHDQTLAQMQRFSMIQWHCPLQVFGSGTCLELCLRALRKLWHSALLTGASAATTLNATSSGLWRHLVAEQCSRLGLWRPWWKMMSGGWCIDVYCMQLCAIVMLYLCLWPWSFLTLKLKYTKIHWVQD